MHDLVLIEILAVPAERSRGRHNPRVVKRKMSSFPTKARAAPSAAQVIRYRDHIRILAPAEDRAAQPSPRPRPPPEPPRPPAPPCRQASWRDHVRAWRESGLKRAAYAESHGLALRTLNQWIGRLRDTFHRRRKAAPCST
jgi:hypothetical protein